MESIRWRIVRVELCNDVDGGKRVVDVVHDDELEDVCDRERVCERKSDGPEFGLLVTSKSNQPKYIFPTHRPLNNVLTCPSVRKSSMKEDVDLPVMLPLLLCVRHVIVKSQ